MTERESLQYTALVGVVGLAALLVPLGDVVDDLLIGETLWSTLLENVWLILLGCGMLAIATQTHRRGWAIADRRRLSRWTLAGVLTGVGFATLVIGTQQFLQRELKPVYLAGQFGIAITVASTVVGIYDVRSYRQREALSIERDRFSGLFENTTDCVAAVIADAEGLRAAERNPAFEESFDRDPVDVLRSAEPSRAPELARTDETPEILDESEAEGVGDTDLDDADSDDADLDDADSDADGDANSDASDEPEPEAIPMPGGSAYCYADLVDAVRSDASYAAEIRVDATDGKRFFRLNTITTPDDRTYVVMTDVTAPVENARLLKQRERKLEREATKREEELAERTSQLEFLHSLLRHDVQNGMMVIRSRGEVLADRLDGEREQYANTIVARADDISDQIDRMRTTLDTLTGGKRTRHRTDLAEVLTDRVEALRRSNPEASVELDIDAETTTDADGDGDRDDGDDDAAGDRDADELVIMADEMVDDVFDNVLRNAIAHNDEDVPRIEVTARTDDDTVRVEVADNGPGIPEMHRDSVFRRGVTAAADADHESGSGFGLFFVDTMVTAYEGSVWIEDNEPTGTRVVFEFPTATAT